MAQEQLPWELEEEILLRIPPLSNTRFRTVCKRWNPLFNDKRFIRNHLARAHPQFILATESKFCSVSVNLDDPPKIKVRELTLDIPGLESQKPKTIYHQDGLLLLTWNENGAITIWNPWLRQSRWVETNTKPENSGYKNIVSQDTPITRTTKCLFKGIINDTAIETWKEYDSGSSIPEKIIIINTNVSLNGTLYWVAASYAYPHSLFIVSLACSTKRMEVFCWLTCKASDFPILAVFRGDRFSLLEIYDETKKIEIKVTKNKIGDGDGESVDWIKFMTVSISQDLVDMRSHSLPSYFIEDKTLVMCCCDGTGQAWIFVVNGNKLSKIQVEVDHPWPLYTTYIPSLVPVSQSQ